MGPAKPSDAFAGTGATPPGGAGSGSGPSPPPGAVGFDGVQAPQLGNYPPAAGASGGKPLGGYPTVSPVTQSLPAGYPGAPAGAASPYAPAGAPPPGAAPGRPPHAVVGMPIAGGGPSDPNDKIGPMGYIAWGLFIAGVFIPFFWVACAFMPLCAARGAKGPKDLLAVRRAAIASSIAMCAYLVLVVIFVSLGQTTWRTCVDRNGYRVPC
ncbi:hypothetical protein Rsub_11788 [Raphidocelis subcapitata]|uniref:Uncharacterized protein n=1 Tax=Raphidocelis subcapitata TaxID=307507 RepID=A0A2V0PMF5_9CHLO|nr:hypothetical protein Rsub_11788 [Raphidocelis subcapitata]|eukprot:GBF99263.1 hypothetical protein Rsub_11788 [Raphidocelis subcapitata]